MITFSDQGAISPWAVDAVAAMQVAGVFSGKSENKFDPQGTATRAETAAVLHRYLTLVAQQATA